MIHTRTILLEDLRQRAKGRPAGYMRDVLSTAVVTATHYTITQERFDALANKYRRPVIDPLDRTRWPRTARWTAALAVGGEQGVGDTVARLLDLVGGRSVAHKWPRLSNLAGRGIVRFLGATMADAFKRIEGSDCGCGDRQEKLNSTYPYKG